MRRGGGGEGLGSRSNRGGGGGVSRREWGGEGAGGRWYQRSERQTRSQQRTARGDDVRGAGGTVALAREEDRRSPTGRRTARRGRGASRGGSGRRFEGGGQRPARTSGRAGCRRQSSSGVTAVARTTRRGRCPHHQQGDGPRPGGRVGRSVPTPPGQAQKRTKKKRGHGRDAVAAAVGV